jgi:hypothetical protein
MHILLWLQNMVLLLGDREENTGVENAVSQRTQEIGGLQEKRQLSEEGS